MRRQLIEFLLITGKSIRGEPIDHGPASRNKDFPFVEATRRPSQNGLKGPPQRFALPAICLYALIVHC